MQLKEKFGPSSFAFIPGAYGFWRSLVLAVAVALLSLSGLFATADMRLYDMFVRHAPEFTPVKRQVALVESPLSAFTDAAVPWDGLAERLIAQGARQVVFTVAPEGDPRVSAALLANPKVVLGSNLDNVDNGPGSPDQVESAAAVSSEQGQAVAAIAESLDGVHRHQRYAHGNGKTARPGLEAAVAARLGVAVPATGTYLIDFSGRESSFPRVALNDLRTEGVIDDMVRDRVILIGPGNERFLRTLVTPLTEGGRGISVLEYHAYALDSLLRGTAIASLPPLAGAFIVLFVWLACFLALQSMPFRKAVATASALGLGLLLLSGLLLMAQVHVPVSACIVIIGLSLVSVFHSKTEHQNRALARIVRETQVRGLDRPSAQPVPNGPGFWTDVLAMVDQILPLTRVVLLERVQGAKRLQEMGALRCSIDSIQERRRDFARAPYSTACETGKAIEVKGYLDDAAAGEHQFLAPLVWSGEVLGFWAFGVDHSRLSDRDTLMRAVDALSQRLSELLWDRRDRMASPGPAPVWREYLIDQRDLAIKKLGEHLQRIERHLDVLEDMFNGLEAPAMVYDLFGRPVVSNERMKALLKANALDVGGKSAADLLEAVCILSAEDARSALISVVFDGASFERVARIGGARYLLHVSCLRNSAQPVWIGADVLQHIHGLMIQLFPVSGAALRETQRVANIAANELDAPNDGTGGDGGSGLEPVDALHEIETAIASTAAIAEHETVSFAVCGSKERTKVLANPRKLRDAFSTLIQFLAQDAKKPGQVTVKLDTDGDKLVVDMQNEGFGMPDEKLQAMLDGPTPPRSELLQRIRRLRDDALDKQAEVAIRSAVGSGYVAKATLRLAN